jgi:hypothetical protein
LKPLACRVSTALLASFSRKLGLPIDVPPERIHLENVTDIRPVDLIQPQMSEI